MVAATMSLLGRFRRPKPTSVLDVPFSKYDEVTGLPASFKIGETSTEPLVTVQQGGCLPILTTSLAPLPLPHLAANIATVMPSSRIH
jgi:hypothetical protein